MHCMCGIADEYESICAIGLRMRPAQGERASWARNDDLTQNSINRTFDLLSDMLRIFDLQFRGVLGARCPDDRTAAIGQRQKCDRTILEEALPCSALMSMFGMHVRDERRLLIRLTCRFDSRQFSTE